MPEPSLAIRATTIPGWFPEQSRDDALSASNCFLQQQGIHLHGGFGAQQHCKQERSLLAFALLENSFQSRHRAVEYPNLVTGFCRHRVQADKPGIGFAAIVYGVDDGFGQAGQLHAESNQCCNTPGGANRAETLLVGNRIQKQVTREQRFYSELFFGSALVWVDGHRQETSEILALQVLQRDVFLPRLGVDREPAGFRVIQKEFDPNCDPLSD